jgi:drug/metabolite transporter (DMT)-like permease
MMTTQPPKKQAKSGNGTEFRYCKPKYQPLWGSLIFAGCLLVVGVQCIFPKAPEWISEIGLLMAIAGLVVFVFGTIAARREWEAKRKTETK